MSEWEAHMENYDGRVVYTVVHQAAGVVLLSIPSCWEDGKQ